MVTSALLDLIDWNNTIKSSFHLENEDVSILLQVEDILSQKYILISLLGHLFNQGDGLIQIIILINSLQESRETAVTSRVDLIKSNWQGMLLQSIVTNLILLVGLLDAEEKTGDHVLGQLSSPHLNDIQEVLSIHVVIAKNGGEESVVSQIIVGERVHKEPVQQPRNGLDVLLIRQWSNLIRTMSSFDEFSHLLERSMLNHIYIFAIQNLTVK